MNRRDFLLLRRIDQKRVVELSCQRLYMRYVEAAGGAALARRRQTAGEDAPWFSGEPPAHLDPPSWDVLLRDLRRELAGADVVRVAEHEWIADEAFRQELEGLFGELRGRNVEVELVTSQ